jgi:hypothetical protein
VESKGNAFTKKFKKGYKKWPKKETQYQLMILQSQLN